MTFKWHQAAHLAEMALRFEADRGGVLPSCWADERKHKGPKRWINQIQNTNRGGSGKLAFDAAAFRDVTVSHLHHCQNRQIVKWMGLVPPTWPSPDACRSILESIFGAGHSFEHAAAARASDYEVVHTGDVVEGHHGATSFLGKVHEFFSVGENFYAIIHTWQCLEATPQWSKWSTENSGLSLICGPDIITACIYAMHGKTVTVLRNGRNRCPAR